MIAAGLAFLETSANPLMGELGDPAGATRRLNWAQAANPLGAITGILIGRFFILSGIEHDERALATMDAAARTAFYKAEVQAIAPPLSRSRSSCCCSPWPPPWSVSPRARRFDRRMRGAAALRRVFRQPRLLGAVVAQFFYVGAQVGVWSYTIRYGQANVGLAERDGADALLLSLALFAAGRFLGSALMGRAAPVKLWRCSRASRCC